ncbi:MAG: hypothetical protein P4L82_19250 [Ancalomicrobiaceae bacterium]|nr:hypothetical protein [Ancalomicrobiaceae bacterium]
MIDDQDVVMTLERFAGLAQSYGGRIERWPQASRQAARSLSTNPEAAAVLAQAAALDAMLDTYSVARPGAELTGRILQTANARLTWQRRLARWCAGIGLIGVAVLGSFAGAMVVSSLTAGQDSGQTFTSDTMTAFGDIGHETNTTQETR